MILAIRNAEVAVEQGSWLGNLGAAGLGVVLVGGSMMLAKKQKLLWNEKYKPKINKKFDARSLISCLLGFAGVTALLGASGMISDLVRWMQGVFLWLGEIEMFASLGMACFTFFAVFKVLGDENDPDRDIVWGGVLALMFPLAGGMFASSSVAVANAMTQLVNGVPST